MPPPPQNTEMEIELPPQSQPSSRDSSKGMKQRDRYRTQHRSRDTSKSRTDCETIIERHQANLQKEYYAGELGVVLNIEETDITDSETLKPSVIRYLYNAGKLKYTLATDTAHEIDDIKEMINNLKIKEPTIKLNSLSKEGFRKVREGKERSPLQSNGRQKKKKHS